jgi:TolB-like protein/class 3 adenylate cyclase
MEHRLAAVVMADVVGYSRLMEADEAGTLAAWKERRTSILEPTVRAHGGRIVKLMGDGVLIEFGSAMHAVTGALELQRKMIEANIPVTDARRIVLRMGINLGDVIGEAGDIYGEGVNIAARLEALAEPGGICISAKVHEEVRGKLPSIFEDMGEQALKNIARSIRVYRVRAGSAIEAASPQPPDLSLPDRPSIAVLPFQNMSGDSEQEYFADGMVEDITTAMSRLRWLFVIARNSSFTYKGRAVDVKQVGRELGVRYVLEGSVRKAGTRVRVTGQLIDTSTGAHLWADRFDGELANIFDLQDQVTASVVGAIAPKLEQAEIERAERKPTQSLDAYDYFLRGMAAFNKFTQASNETALAHFYRAIELDPRFAAAYGMAARCYLQRKGFGWVADRDREVAETRRLAGQAAELGRDDAVALSAAGMALIAVAGDLDEGADLVEQAVVLNPNLAWAAHFSALTKAFLGEPGPAIEHAARAMRLSPQDPQMFAMQSATALAHFIAGRYDAASSWAEAALRQRSNFLMALGIAAASGVLAGKTEQAQKAMARLRELNPALRMSNVKTWMPFRRSEDYSRWAEGLARAGLPE